MLIEKIINDFHEVYYNSKVHFNTSFMGIPTWKCPLDLWIYQEILFSNKPNLVIECGTGLGGTAVYLSFLLKLINDGKVITIDKVQGISLSDRMSILQLIGNSISNEIVEKVKNQISSDDKVMVILDSDHRKDHVLKEMEIYSPFVTKGQYMIVEDTNVNGHPVLSNHGPGPAEAIMEFGKDHFREFEVDPNMEKFGMTFNPGGYLLKVKDGKTK